MSQANVRSEYTLVLIPKRLRISRLAVGQNGRRDVRKQDDLRRKLFPQFSSPLSVISLQPLVTACVMRRAAYLTIFCCYVFKRFGTGNVEKKLAEEEPLALSRAHSVHSAYNRHFSTFKIKP